MSTSSIVQRLMLPMSEYATVSEDATLHEALSALAKAQERVQPGRQKHRAVLVERSKGIYVGLLDYRTILSALRPKQHSISLDDTMRSAGVSEDMVSTSLASLHFFEEDLPSLCDRACSIKINELILSTPKTIGIDAPLHTLLEDFSYSNAMSMLVSDGSDVIGVIRVSDLFDEVTRAALGEHGGTCASDEDN